MAYDGPDRRKQQQPFDGKERRYVRHLSDAELQVEVHDLRERVEKLEDGADKLADLPDAVSELNGSVKVLNQMVLGRFDHVDESVQQATGLRTAITFASVVIVPIVIALIGGYFALKTGTGAR